MIDLHAHTTASDGSLTPTELVTRAMQTGLTAIAVTDHDTVDGVEAACETGRRLGIEVVPGIEISVDYPHGEFHLLGYYVDIHHGDFLSTVRFLQESRFNRNAVMLRKIQEHGFEISEADVLAEAGGGQVGRPHFAKALVRKGYATSVKDAFDRYLGDAGPLRVPKVRLGPEEAIDLVHRGGGAAVMAHPKYTSFSSETELREEVSRLKALGLDGLECYYSQHTEEETAAYLRIAAELELVVTGGSDFHGATKPDVPLGVVYRGRPCPDEMLDAIKRAAQRRAGNNRLAAAS